MCAALFLFIIWRCCQRFVYAAAAAAPWRCCWRAPPAHAAGAARQRAIVAVRCIGAVAAPSPRAALKVLFCLRHNMIRQKARFVVLHSSMAIYIYVDEARCARAAMASERLPMPPRLRYFVFLRQRLAVQRYMLLVRRCQRHAPAALFVAPFIFSCYDKRQHVLLFLWLRQLPPVAFAALFWDGKKVAQV